MVLHARPFHSHRPSTIRSLTTSWALASDRESILKFRTVWGGQEDIKCVGNAKATFCARAACALANMAPNAPVNEAADAPRHLRHSKENINQSTLYMDYVEYPPT